MKQANINSKNPYYVLKSGKVVNQYRQPIALVNSKGTLVLKYRDIENKNRSISLPKLMWITFYPEDNLNGFKIYRRNPNLKDSYNIRNLFRLPVDLMTLDLNTQKPFYENFSAIQKRNLKKFLEHKPYTSEWLAMKYGVCVQTIRNAKKRLIDATENT